MLVARGCGVYDRAIMQWLRSTSLTLVALSLLACNTGGGGGDTGQIMGTPVPEEELPEASASLECELLFSCNCEDPGHPDLAACEEAEGNQTTETQTEAQAAGLTYDPQCAGDLLALAESTGCTPIIELECENYCAIYHGDAQVDQPCTATSASFSNCAQGLVCVEGSCRSACGDAPLALGEACRDAEGASLGVCDSEAGHFCDFASETCIELPGVGEPCYSGEVCGVGAVCSWEDAEPLCVPVPGPGEACTYVCGEGYYCDGVDGSEGVCTVLPANGEPCAPISGGCAEGLICNAADVCEPAPAWVCGQ